MQMLMNSTKTEAWAVEQITHIYLEGWHIKADLKDETVILGTYDTHAEAKEALGMLAMWLNSHSHSVIIMPSPGYAREKLEARERAAGQ